MSITTMHDGRVVLHQADCRDVLRGLPDNSIDSVVTDPPYALVSIQKRFGKPGSAAVKIDNPEKSGCIKAAYARASAGFMGKQWDTGEVAFSEEFWAEVLRVLKPGGHVVAFSGTRTYHRMAVAIEDAGFEIRDQLGWVYGCLDDQTMAVTPHGVMPYHKINQGDLVLAYDPAHMSYQWEQVQEVCVYDVDDTVYRIATDFGDQVVSRNHRCIIERDGTEAFEFAENASRQPEIRVPVLEDLRALLDAVPDAHQGTSVTQSDVFAGLYEGASGGETVCYGEACGDARAQNAGHMHGLRDDVLAKHEAPGAGEPADVQFKVQRGATRPGVEGVRAYGQGELEAGVRSGAGGAHDGRDEPGLEGRSDIPQSQGELRLGSVCEVSAGVHADVAQGRVCDGASLECGDGDRSSSDAGGMCASHRPQSVEQRTDEPDAVRDEQGPQTVRAWSGHKAVVGRITPERYRGVIWCVRVKSGAFVAVRNGFAFPTGNSGFPKSHNQHGDWEGWGTALKPAWEPIALARKPLTGTVAANLAEWGVGAINVDGCRVAANGERLGGGGSVDDAEGWGSSMQRKTDSAKAEALGRWPANIVHDGSDEVLAAFPDAPGQQRAVEDGQRTRANVYGEPSDNGKEYAPRIDIDKSAARFFYCAKASRADRDAGLEGVDGKRANSHPTVKPVSLCQWLCRLVTPPGGVILDPFMGSGSSGKAAVLEGFQFVGIEREEEYMPIAVARIAWAIGAVGGKEEAVSPPRPANDNLSADLFAPVHAANGDAA